MKTSLRSVILLALLSALAACGSPDAAAVGTYELDVDALIASMPMPPGAENSPEAKKMIESMKGNMSGTIELKADHTASMKFKMPMVGENNDTGTWKLEGETLTITTEDEKDGTKTAICKDGTITVTEEQGGQKMTMTFKKK